MGVVGGGGGEGLKFSIQKGANGSKLTLKVKDDENGATDQRKHGLNDTRRHSEVVPEVPRRKYHVYVGTEEEHNSRSYLAAGVEVTSSVQLLRQLTIVNRAIFLHTHNTYKAQAEGCN